MEGGTGMTKLTAAFRNFANAPKQWETTHYLYVNTIRLAKLYIKEDRDQPTIFASIQRLYITC